MKKYKVSYSLEEIHRPQTTEVIHKRDKTSVVDADNINEAAEKFFQQMNALNKCFNIQMVVL